MNTYKQCNVPILEEDIDKIIQDDKIDWKTMDGSTFLVTGATGLIGSLIVKTLLKLNQTKEMNIHIIAMIRNEEKAKRMFTNFEYNNKRLEFYVHDINEVIEIDKSVDFIIHGASITTSKTMIEKPVETLLTSINGTKNILDYAKKYKVRSMVYISSMEVYGQTDLSLDLIEESNIGYIDIMNIRSSYSEGKRVCECLCNAYSKEYNIPTKIARLAQTFGAGVNYEDSRIFSQFAKHIINNENIVLHTSGESMGNYCYTSDAIRAIFYLLLYGEVANSYNIVNEKNTMKIKEMANLLIKNFNESIEIVYDIPLSNIFGYSPSTTMKLSAKKLRYLGWTPNYDLVEMYQRLMMSWNIEVCKRD